MCCFCLVVCLRWRMRVGSSSPCKDCVHCAVLSHRAIADTVLVSFYRLSFFLPPTLFHFPPPLHTSHFHREIFGPIKSEYGVHMRAGDFRDAFSAYSKKNGLEMDAHEGLKPNAGTCHYTALPCVKVQRVELHWLVFLHCTAPQDTS